MKIIQLSIAVMALLMASKVQAQITFNNLDSLINYAIVKSTTIQSGNIKFTQAQKAKLAATVGVFDPTVSTSYSYIDNIKLPTSIFPAEALGGEPGTYKEIQTGVQYNSNFVNYNELKLLNVSGWANLKLAKINIDLTSTDNKITFKSLCENIASVYFNIINVQEQLKATEENLLAADTLLYIAKNKLQQGLVKQQDVNDSKANYLNAKESCNQLRYLLQQQYLSLKILIDIPEHDSIAITQAADSDFVPNKSKIDFNELSLTSAEFNEEKALANYKHLKQSNIPTISFINHNSTQQYNTTAKIYNGSGRWYSNTYVGFKITIPIPTAASVSQTSKARYDYQLAKMNTEHFKVKSTLENHQLSIDFNKAVSQWTTNAEVYELKKDSYLKNLNLYSEGLLSLDQTLNSYNAMVNSNYNRISSAINVLYAQSKIDINNKIK